ncbi:serine protease [Staphylococcus lugdunensis]|jgi:membrane-bound ClpP family serine protease|uniref:Serine protease n=1 Tax=Staphylococcus lugdunensis TaxID=28035 RepID=A0A292DFN3_STALU|nr:MULTISPECIES: NfeD family protein [Staphylococcus]MBF9299512.1 serine protease [Staphylococcus schleiferi]AMG60570.1 serine protease [Staphylococcus lugdunensis]ARJ11385.1 serine protease [Staphylococcus lugdunensis]ARJ13895.1 serine protease [Staphylococcus lugdunensis]ARJ27296.1 serine protease [Staphylococcus lugdunensis]
MTVINGIHTFFLLNFSSDVSWIFDVAQILTHPLMTLILTVAIFLGFLYQLYSPKINLIGVVAALCLLLLFLGFLINGDVNLISVILFGIGVIFVIIELFIVGAVIGFFGIVLISLSLIMLGDNLFIMLFNVIIAVILSIVEWVILVKLLNRKIPFFEKVVLKDSTNAEAGYRSHDDRSHLVGKIARTSTDLRPAGIILINDERIDAVSDGSFILRNKDVKILEVEGTRVVVREID